MPAKLVIMRHGQSTANAENRFTGQFDAPLTELGEDEARVAAQKITDSGIGFDVIFSSPLIRAVRTTEIALGKNRSKFILHDALKEHYYGSVEGLKKSEVAKQYGEDAIDTWRHSYDTPPPGGETFKSVVSRVNDFYKNEVLPLIEDEKSVFIGAHHHVIKAMFIVLGLKSEETIHDIKISNCDILLFPFNEQGEIGQYSNLSIKNNSAIEKLSAPLTLKGL